MVRPIEPGDAGAWGSMRARLWPDADPTVLQREADSFCSGSATPAIDAVFVAGDDPPIGFLELSVRPYANGCDSMPVPFVEGWYVEPEARSRGAGRGLMLAAEAWARERGYNEIGSDTQLENDASRRAHQRCGLVETERIVYFRKPL
ncbi:MAG TPA: GNAT family N-acetyltransferase [Candidatus Tumulicola sp.]|nr:GNAT family N-acetyltransferase [Candidatus Tumulicola sp.]